MLPSGDVPSHDIIPPVTLTQAQVEHIAALARLELTPEEKASFHQQLSAILDYFAQLQEVDTTGIAPEISDLPAGSPLRPDEPRPGLPTGDLLANAPQVEDDQFRVPPVFE
jgi:aspartyl-tRNA(Asn)/glutamyl-tRNA(Gln) amidotransferase subunit C